MAKITNPNYEVINDQAFKEPILVVCFEGLSFCYATAVTYTNLKYDDPGVNYDVGFIYDGLRPIGTDKIKSYIDRKSTKTTISQKLEQWDGRASIETFNMTLVDVNGHVTNLITPGQQLPEIINNKVRVYFGYKDISYPEDYIRIFTGYVNQYKSIEGKVQFDFTDPSSRRKQVLFNATTTRITSPVSPGDTTIYITASDQLYQTILDAKGNADAGVTIGINVNDEIMYYTNAGISPGALSVTRGQFGTVAGSHSVNDEVKCFIVLNDNPINIALKLMLSGWNAPCVTDVGLRGIINTDDGFTVPDSITFDQGVNVVNIYGLVIGDYVIMSDFTDVVNNGTFTIAGFANNNRTIIFQETGILFQVNPPPSGHISPGTVAFRSKYDVYPVTAGLGLTPDDVFVKRHEELRDTFVPYEFTLPALGFEKSGKDFIEQHIMKPIGAYTLTQGSKISMGLTHPPLAEDFTRIISNENVINPKDIVVTRGLNQRFFYNEILYNYGYDVVADTFYKSIRVVDATAQDRMQQVSVLEVNVRGLPDNPTTETILKQRAKRLLLRYRYATETVDLKTFFSVGHLIDAGDIVVLTDNETSPQMKISNTETGERGIINRVMEVQERSIDLSSGQTTLKLLSNNGFSITDRYGVIGPSSLVDVGYSPTSVKIKESFGGKFQGQEYLKWRDYQGSRVRVHSSDFTRDSISTFSLDPSNPFILNFDTALGFTPLPDDIVTFAPYDESSAASQSAIKSVYAFISRTGHIVSGSSSNVFTLDLGEGANYIPGNIIYVQSPDGTTHSSPDLKILTVIGDTVTVGAVLTGAASDCGFIPTVGDYLKLGGFGDAGQSYRYI